VDFGKHPGLCQPLTGNLTARALPDTYHCALSGGQLAGNVLAAPAHPPAALAKARPVFLGHFDPVYCRGFLFHGLIPYCQDISLIDHLIVQPARWVAENVPSEKIIAVHDIGAMGYFSGHQLVDLAGLANPEVIPFMRDEPRLHQYLLEKGCAYFVGFSDWYSSSSQWGRVVQTFTANYQNQPQTVVIIDLQ